jgi:DNA mismatch endonuclease (patch repair protein)
MRQKSRSKDKLTKQQRSSLMAKVGPRNTKPELIVRRLLHKYGYRYRLHKKSLPGSPDIVFSSRKKIIFVHGCFWHRHDGCKMTTTPSIRKKFWEDKFAANIHRDIKNIQVLKDMGWKSLVVWECQTRNIDSIGKSIFKFLES